MRSSPGGSGRERLPAAAAVTGVGIFDLEPGLLEAIDEIERRTDEVERALFVYEHANAEGLDLVVVFILGFVKRKLILQARTAATDPR